MDVPKKKPSIAVDFDGVIHRYSKGWQDGSIYDVPMVGAKESLKTLGKTFNIIIFTIRLSPLVHANDVAEQQRMLENWFKKYGFVEGIHYHEMTAIKPRAKVYLDDRALRFTDWDESLQKITEPLFKK